MAIDEQVHSIIRKLIDVDDAELVPSAHLRDNLGITSIERVELITALENQFDIDIRDADVLRFTTLGELIECVTEKTSGSVAG
jgi:acyl carrier protein